MKRGDIGAVADMVLERKPSRATDMTDHKHPRSDDEDESLLHRPTSGDSTWQSASSLQVSHRHLTQLIYSAPKLY